MGDSEWCPRCDAFPCECYCTCGRMRTEGVCEPCSLRTGAPLTYLGKIAAQCDALKAVLLSKNAAYGNSAFKPLGIFADGNALSLVAARMDDKLSRIKAAGGLIRALGDGQEDTVMDLAGYLILAKIINEER